MKMNASAEPEKQTQSNPTCRGVASGEAGSNPIPERPKMNVTSILTKDYENETAFALRRNKPNQTQPVVSLSNLFQTQKNPPKTLFFSNSNLCKNFPAILMLSFSLLLVCKQFVQWAWAEALQVNGYKLKTQRF